MQYDLRNNSVILATGSSPIGHKIAKELGHDIMQPVPSLFTLNSNKIVKNLDAPFHDLAGVSVQKAKVTFRVKGKIKVYHIHIFHPTITLHFSTKLQSPWQ